MRSRGDLFHTRTFNPFPKRHILDSSKLKEKTIFNLTKMVKRFWVENTVGKRRNCSIRAISRIPTVFSKRYVLQTHKNQGLFGKGLSNIAFGDSHLSQDCRVILHATYQRSKPSIMSQIPTPI